MPRADLTDITVVLDRSGSMEACKNDAEGGLNSFVKEQQKLPGEANFTLVQFDTIYEVVHNGIKLQDVPHINLVPRGNTALLDAVGRAIVTVGERLKGIDEKDRPGLVVFVIVTDGEENSSKEYSRDKIKAMVEEQQNKYKWQFTFLAANIDAFAAAGDIAIKTSAALNFAPDNAKEAYAAAHSNVARMRGMSAKGQSVDNTYTAAERKDATDKK